MSTDGNDGGFSKIADGLATLVNLLVDLDKRGDLPRRGRREKNGLVVEYSIGRRTADGSPAEPSPPEEPPAGPTQRAGQQARRRSGAEVVEPVTDMFDESDDVVLLFELPGVSLTDIRCALDGDILLLEAPTDGRRYRKEVLIEVTLTDEPPRLRLHNGVLEVRLRKHA